MSSRERLSRVHRRPTLPAFSVPERALGERSGGLRAMRVLGLPRVPELGDRRSTRRAGRRSGRTRSPRSPRGSVAIAPFERARRAHLRAVGGEHDELADVARPAILDALELREQAARPRRRPSAPTRRPAGRRAPRPRSPSPRPRPSPRGACSAAVPRLDARVVEEGVAVLDRLVGRVEQLDLPAGSAARSSRSLFSFREARTSFTRRGAAAASACAR